MPDRPAAGQVRVVEDEPAHSMLLVEVLGDEGYAMHTASDGEEALAAIAGAAPDLNLLDMRMRGMGAGTFARTYHALPPPHAPIVLVSADTAVHELAATLGAAAALTKPYSLKGLVSTVRRLMPRHAGRRRVR